MCIPRVVAGSSIMDAGTITAASSAAVGSIGKRQSPSARRPKLRPGPPSFYAEFRLVKFPISAAGDFFS
jgi:hypothetical protein